MQPVRVTATMLLLAAAWLVAGSEPSTAVYWGSVVVGPALMLSIGLAIAWAASPLVGREWAPLAGAVAIAQPALTAYAAPGRSDHHALILLLGAVGSGAVIRLLTDRDRCVKFGIHPK